ncbi:MAG: flagellar hook-basal body protein [Bdellovibrionota bacterium]|jgi:flagellar basal-body rod protein FlgF
MDRGTYAAASNGVMQLRKLDITTNNLANLKTAGFKKQVLVGNTQTFDETLASLQGLKDPYAKYDHERTPGVTNTMAVTDFSIGSIETTNNPLNVAIKNENEFFTIQGENGEMLYTKAGDFTLNENSELVLHDGKYVLGGGSPIPTTGVGKIQIAANGEVLSDNNVVGALTVVRIDDLKALERVGGNCFKIKDGESVNVEEVSPNLIENSLEMSNVSAVNSILDLMTAHRGFQLYTQTANSIDQMNQTSITRVGVSR